MRDQRRVVQPVRAVALAPGQPVVRRPPHLCRGGRAGGQVQPGAVGGDGLERDAPRRTLRQGVREGGAQLPGPDPRGGQLLRDRLHPHHLVHAGRCQVGQLVEAAQAGPRQAGVDQQVAGAAVPQQRPRGLPRPELRPAGQVGVRVGVRVQPEQRGAPAAHRQADLGVELAGAGRAGVAGLGEQQLELAALQRRRARRGGSAGRPAEGPRAPRAMLMPLVAPPGRRDDLLGGVVGEQVDLGAPYRGEGVEEVVPHGLPQQVAVLEAGQRRRR